MKKQLTVLFAVTLFGALAWAADQAKLNIQSPAQGASVAALPNGTGVVMIKFKTDHFKIVSLKNEPIGGNTNVAPSAQAASEANDSGTPAGAGPASNASTPGGSQSGAPSAAPGGATSASNQMPQSDNANAQQPPAGSSNEGFIDVDVDGTAWHFLHSTSDPIVIAGLSPGAHRVAMQLFGSNLKPVGEPQLLNFTISGGTAK